jgi:Concanavalin A-like lectin/glucanases superfamily
MKVSGSRSVCSQFRIAELLVLFVATSTMGCVSLEKPKVVQACAATNSCSDDPTQQPGQDAKQDAQWPGPDSQAGDAHTATADLAPEGHPQDARADQAGQGRDTKDDTGTDVKVTDVPPEADGAVAPADSRPDWGPDANQQDLGTDMGPDRMPDLSPDTAPDLRPDLGPDTSPDASTLLSGLLVYYKCESASGSTLQDFSGNGNHGTLVGGTAGYSFIAGKVGNALALAKAGSGYVSVPPAVFAKATDITIATWVNVTTSQNWQRVFDVGINANLANNTSTGTHYMNLVPKNDGSNLAFAISKDGYGSEQVLTSSALPTGTWKHVAVVLGPGQGSLYVDGALVANSSTVSLRPVDLGTTDYAYLGKSQFTSDPYFDGQIDEFRVYGRALSSAEIQALSQFAGP